MSTNARVLAVLYKLHMEGLPVFTGVHSCGSTGKRARGSVLLNYSHNQVLTPSEAHKPTKHQKKPRKHHLGLGNIQLGKGQN